MKNYENIANLWFLRKQNITKEKSFITVNILRYIFVVVARRLAKFKCQIYYAA